MRAMKGRLQNSVQRVNLIVINVFPAANKSFIKRSESVRPSVSQTNSRSLAQPPVSDIKGIPAKRYLPDVMMRS